jgi:hypothetical protein
MLRNITCKHIVGLLESVSKVVNVCKSLKFGHVRSCRTAKKTYGSIWGRGRKNCPLHAMEAHGRRGGIAPTHS